VIKATSNCGCDAIIHFPIPEVAMFLHKKIAMVIIHPTIFEPLAHGTK